MKKVLLLILALLMLCACGVQEEHQDEITIDKELISENPIADDSAEQKQEDNKQENDTQQTYEKTVVAHTNFELENGGFEPEFIVTLSEDLILEGEGDNLSVIFPDENSLLLGWCFIYEIREYDKYDNPLYYYDNPEESLGYISHETVNCGSYECLRITNQQYSGKEDSDSVFYRFDYFVKVNGTEILSLSFFAPNNLENTLKTQEDFISTIKR